MKYGFLITDLVLFFLFTAVVYGDNVAVTKHNLSVSGTGPAKAAAESEICIFCHTPHAANNDVPLWNRDLSYQDSTTYTQYDSGSMDAATGQPSGHTKLCLSCHDGVIAIGAIGNAPGSGAGSSIQMTGTASDGTMRYGPSNQVDEQFTGNTRRLGTDLSNDHPVSFIFNNTVYANDSELVDPVQIGYGTTGNPITKSTKPVALYPLGFTGQNQAIQCTSCHNPHGEKWNDAVSDQEAALADMYPKFLRTNLYNNWPKSNEEQICLACHVAPGYVGKPGWEGSIHERSTLQYRLNVPGVNPDAYGNGTEFTISRAGCLNCHDPHTMQGADRLHRNGSSNDDGTGTPAIENTCFQCHISSAQKVPVLNGTSEDRFIPAIPINKEIKPQFDKPNAMPLNINWNGNSTDGIHQPVFVSSATSDREDVLFDPSDCVKLPSTCSTPEVNVHVECVDCHNPHQVTDPSNPVVNDPTPNTNGGRLEGMKGIKIDGNEIGFNTSDSTRDPYVFEVCFRCHGDTYDRNMSRPDITYPPDTSNPRPNSNKRREFNPATLSKSYTTGGSYVDLPCDNNPTCNRAFHPVALSGRNTSTALNNQLLDGLNTSRTIVCTDCHNNDQMGVGTTYSYGGLTAFTPTYPGPITQSNLRAGSDVDNGYDFSSVGPLGPHGSTNWRILRADFNATLGTTSSAPFSNWDPARFQLCFNCHDSRAFIDTDGIVSGSQFTNFRQNIAGCASTKTNLHATHLTDLPGGGFGPWAFLNNMYTTCANCHFNVHSNAEAVNTIYGNGNGGSLPADGDTHLINFSPVVQPNEFAKPRWYYYSGGGCPPNCPSQISGMRCNLICHGVKMGWVVFGWGGSEADAVYTLYGS